MLLGLGVWTEIELPSLGSCQPRDTAFTARCLWMNRESIRSKRLVNSSEQTEHQQHESRFLDVLLGITYMHTRVLRPFARAVRGVMSAEREVKQLRVM